MTRRTGDRDAAADLVQDAFARLFAAGSSGSAESDTRLLYAIARNAAIDYRRMARRRTGLLSSLVPEQLARAPASAEAHLVARRALDALEEQLGKLPRRTQDAFVLRRVHGLSHAEIADVLGVSVSTVEKDLSRALRHCQARLAAHWEG